VTIGVICAIPQEWAYLRSVLSGPDSEQIAHISFDTGELEAHRVVLAAAGMGKVNTGLGNAAGRPIPLPHNSFHRSRGRTGSAIAHR
jgi:nucleoside phosphorylase